MIVRTNDVYYNEIADAIRLKLGVATTYYPSEMAAAIMTIPVAGGTEVEAISEFDYVGWAAGVSFDSDVTSAASGALAEVAVSLDMSDIGFTFESDAESTASSAAVSALAEVDMNNIGFTFTSSAVAA